MAIILDGKKVAKKIEKELEFEASELKGRGIMPGLAVVLLGNNPASLTYVKNKEKACQRLGIFSELIHLPEDTSEKKLLDLLQKLNTSKKIHGILVQLPLPKHVSEEKILYAISPKKDVDCFHPENVGRVTVGDKIIFYPCTPEGILILLKEYKINLTGKDCLIIGKSNIVGKPLANMLMNLDATVTICHFKSKNLNKKCREADIIFSATGKAGLITADMIKQKAVIVDVGVSKDENGKAIGDVDFAGVSQKAKAITPVPGGVGPMTIACLMKNTLKAAKKYANRS